jgi:hypothetical protein
MMVTKLNIRIASVLLLKFSLPKSIDRNSSSMVKTLQDSTAKQKIRISENGNGQGILSDQQLGLPLF